MNLTDILTDKYSEDGAATFKSHLLTNEIQRLAFVKEKPEAVKKLIRLLTYLYVNEIVEKVIGLVNNHIIHQQAVRYNTKFVKLGYNPSCSA